MKESIEKQHFQSRQKGRRKLHKLYKKDQNIADSAVLAFYCPYPILSGIYSHLTKLEHREHTEQDGIHVDVFLCNESIRLPCKTEPCPRKSYLGDSFTAATQPNPS